MTNYLVKNRRTSETLVIGGDDVTLNLESRWGMTMDEAGDDSVSLQIKVGSDVVELEADDLAELLHPLITALRILLHNGTTGEDALDDAWGSPT